MGQNLSYFVNPEISNLFHNYMFGNFEYDDNFIS